MELSPLLLLGGWAQLLPALALGLARVRTRSAWGLALGASIGLLSDLTGRYLATTLGNNLMATHLSTPLAAACWLTALGEWQVDPAHRRAFRWGIVGFIVIWGALILTIQDIRDFGSIITPFYSLPLLAAGLWTLLQRAQVSLATPILGADWFWGGTGLALQGAAMALAASVGALLLRQGRPDLFDLVWHIRASLLIISYGLMSWSIYRGPLRVSPSIEEAAP
jgi:hypothetical protein